MMAKSEIAAVLDEIATLLELTGENPFKIRAYSAGARALEALTDDLGELIATASDAQSGELHHQPAVVAIDQLWQLRPRAYQAHVALQHVEELRQLVDRGAAQEAADLFEYLRSVAN